MGFAEHRLAQSRSGRVMGCVCYWLGWQWPGLALDFSSYGLGWARELLAMGWLATG
jgi:1,4-dihydroxy-2-naphthoate octaprenyltransferase